MQNSICFWPYPCFHSHPWRHLHNRFNYDMERKRLIHHGSINSTKFEDIYYFFCFCFFFWSCCDHQLYLTSSEQTAWIRLHDGTKKQTNWPKKHKGKKELTSVSSSSLLKEDDSTILRIYDQIVQLWGVYAYAYQTHLLCIVFLIFDAL